MSMQVLNFGLNTIWVVLTAAMILLMEGGFALLEAGKINRQSLQEFGNGIRRSFRTKKRTYSNWLTSYF